MNTVNKYHSLPYIHSLCWEGSLAHLRAVFQPETHYCQRGPKMLSTSRPLFEPFLTLIQYLLGKGHLEIPSKYTWFKTLGEHLHVLWNFRLSLKHFSLCQELHPMNHSWKGSHTPQLRLLRAHPWPQALQGWGTHSSIHLPLHTHSWDCPDATPCTCWTSLYLGGPPVPYGHHSSPSLHGHRAADHSSLLHHTQRCCPSRQHSTDGNRQRISVAVLTSPPKCRLSRCLVPQSTWGRKKESF